MFLSHDVAWVKRPSDMLEENFFEHDCFPDAVLANIVVSHAFVGHRVCPVDGATVVIEHWCRDKDRGAVICQNISEALISASQELRLVRFFLKAFHISGAPPIEMIKPHTYLVSITDTGREL